MKDRQTNRMVQVVLVLFCVFVIAAVGGYVLGAECSAAKTTSNE